MVRRADPLFARWKWHPAYSLKWPFCQSNIGATFAHSVPDQGPASNGVQLGDWQALAQYRLTQFDEESSIPTLSAVVRETFPTGRYDRLGDHLASGSAIVRYAFSDASRRTTGAAPVGAVSSSRFKWIANR